MIKRIFIVLLSNILILLFIFIMLSVLDISFFGFRFFKVGSGSMEPTLKTGDIILVQKQDSYNVGDIVTYRLNEEYITHRIIELNENNIITKGDFNNTEDEKITKKQIIGKYIFSISYKLYILFNPVIFFSIFLLITIIKLPLIKKY